MKKKLIITTGMSVLLLSASALTAFAQTDVNSTGNLVTREGAAAFYSEDITLLQAKADELTGELPEAYAIASESYGEGAFKNSLKSTGRISYASGKVVFDAADLIRLADEIDNIDLGHKKEAVENLKQINTYFNEDGSVTHTASETTVTADNASALSFADICAGILKSQSVEQLSSEGVNAATADNLSKGSAAWVDGKLLVGTGADNETSYGQGHDAGYTEGYTAGYDDGEAAGLAASVCYRLGNTLDIEEGEDGCYYYDIKTLLPDIDYTKLTESNFIAATNNVERFAAIYGITSKGSYVFGVEPQGLSAQLSYDASEGLLCVTAPAITVTSGTDAFTEIAVPLSAEIYLCLGEIVTP